MPVLPGYSYKYWYWMFLNDVKISCSSVGGNLLSRIVPRPNGDVFDEGELKRLLRHISMVSMSALTGLPCGY